MGGGIFFLVNLNGNIPAVQEQQQLIHGEMKLILLMLIIVPVNLMLLD